MGEALPIVSIVNYTAARLLFERSRFAERTGFAHTRAEAVALSVSGVCLVGDAGKPQTGAGISRGDPAPQ